MDLFCNFYFKRSCDVLKLKSPNDTKVWVFFEKNIEKKHSCHHDKNYCYFFKSDVPKINLIVGSINMIRISKKYEFVKN